jgi:UDP-2,3-diacylglucosamine hydrolase
LSKAYFISDTHFGFYEYAKEKPLIEKFEKLCKQISDEVGSFYILGDLFDYWFEYKSVIQKYSYRILTCLEKMSEKGVSITYIIGNHDFAHRDLFEKELKIRVYDHPITEFIHNKKFLLAHGDGLIGNDRGYQILKSIVRNKKLQSIYSKLHPNIGIGLAKYFSKKSRDYTSEKDYGENDYLLQYSKQKIKEGYDYVVMGHSHRFSFEKIDSGYYINLGCWLIKPAYGVFDGQKFEIKEI